MSDRVNAFDDNTWDAEERAYFKYVDEVIGSGKDERFSNGRPWHAAYLIFKFLQAAKQQVRIFSGTLVCTTPGGVRIYEEPHIVKAAGDFLRQPGSVLRIALEKEIDAPHQNPNEHPLVAGVRHLQEQGQLGGTLEIRRVYEEATEWLRERQVLHHMMLLDERGWRLETDPNPMDVKAIVNAGNADEARSLCRAYDAGVWRHGETLVSVAA